MLDMLGVEEDRLGRNVLPWVKLCYVKLNIAFHVVRG
jgi:hypothetical protein